MGTSTTEVPTEQSGRAVADGVSRLGTHRINWYVLEADDGVTVVDAGLPGHWPQLGDWLDETEFEIDDVDALLLTHVHADHVGFASELADRGVTVYCHPDELARLRDLPHGAPVWLYRNLWRPAFVRYVVEMVRDGIRAIEPVADAEPLDDGDVLPVPGEPRVVAVPGHTPGSCAFVVDDRDVLFTGDALVTRNVFTDREGDPQLLGAPDEDHDEARASLARLEGLGSVTILPGHGDPWRGDVDVALDDAR